ncbi:MAG: hypothetical protein IIC53_08190 [Proteobacteria bacterium]|nr:hypothetical protein [Pseudomonadota bacterium]
MMLLPVIALILVQDGELTLRRAEVPPPGKIAFVSTDGVVIEDETGTQVTVGWQRVLQIEGEFSPQWEMFREIADQAWRAQVRLERGDVAAAEPLLEDLSRVYAGHDGPTANMVWTGLLRARLQRGALVAAIEPWLELVAGGSALSELTDESGVPIIDVRTGLAPALPPIWVDWPAVQAFAARELDPANTETGADRLAMLYRAAARIEAGWDLEVVAVDLGEYRGSDGMPDAPGVDLVEQMVRARVGSEGERARARAALFQILDSSSNAWEHAWIRCAIGRSLIHEADEVQERRGVVQLLYVPATLGDTHPYLAGLALAESVVALDRLGDGAGADQLYAELLERYADHPVMDWPVIRERRSSG